MNRGNEEQLENFVREVTRDLPARPAPGALVQRVQAEIARRAALPWYRKSFAYWPVAAQVAFLLVGVGLVAALIGGANWVHLPDAAQARAVFASELAWVQAAGVALARLGDVFAALLPNVSPVWLYGGAAVIAGLYITLFGLGAAAYRTLYANR